MRVWMLLVLVILVFAAAAVLFPLLVKDGSSHKATCISNVNQIALAAIMYAEEYGACLPNAPGRAIRDRDQGCRQPGGARPGRGVRDLP